MPRLLDERTMDPIQMEVDQAISAADEADDHVGDLSDGGSIGGVTITPMDGSGRKLKEGRPTTRLGWMWNGTPSEMPLAWNPDGTRHDGARHYLLKRHCTCCKIGGFLARQCPACVQSRCMTCRSGTDRSKVIPNFYLTESDVPFPEQFYGSINCFLEFCPRRDAKGFKSDTDMRLHAQSRHKKEYQAHLQSQLAGRPDEMMELVYQMKELQKQGEELRRENAENRAFIKKIEESEDKNAAMQGRMARMRAAKRKKS